MTTPNTPSTVEDQKSSDRVGYAVRPPPVGVEESVAIIKSLVNVAGERGPLKGLADVMGYSPNSSNFRFKASAIRKLGTIKLDNLGYAITETGRKIARPQAPDDLLIGVQTIFFSLPTLKQMWEHYEGQTLPLKDYVSNFLHTSLQVPLEITTDWFDYFVAAGLYAKLLERLPSGSYQVLPKHTPGTLQPSSKLPVVPVVSPLTPISPPDEQRQIESLFEGLVGGMVFRKKISNNRVALFFVPEDLTQNDATAIASILQAIQAALEGLKAQSE